MAKDSMSDETGGTRQYLAFIERMEREGTQSMGPMTSWGWYDDPRRLSFTLSRYKFVAKMFEGYNSVLEVGCGDGFGSHVVAQTVGSVKGVDIEPNFIKAAEQHSSDKFSIEFDTHDMLTGPLDQRFDGVYSLDVLEHIDADKEERFLENVTASLKDDGAVIIGMPSIESQVYASEYSRMGHVNCKDQPALRSLLSRFFDNVFVFSMNDEVVHTGYGKMAHYHIALCCGKK